MDTILSRRKKMLVIIAAIIWFGGFISLGLKAFFILHHDYHLNGELELVILIAIGGFLAGLIKAGLVFIKSAKKNIRRILQLKNPKIWLFYEPRFTIFLGLMISLAVVLTRIAERVEGFHYGIAALDVSLATALLLSGFAYFNRKNYQVKKKK